MTPHPELLTIASVHRLGLPTVYRVYHPRLDLHVRHFNHVQDAIDWATLHLPNQAIDMQIS